VLDAAQQIQRLLDRSTVADVDPAYLPVARVSWGMRLPITLAIIPRSSPWRAPA
jgi:hypothetical protein